MSPVRARAVLGAFFVMALAACEVHVGDPARAPANPTPGAAPAPAAAPAPGAAPAAAPAGFHRGKGGNTVMITTSGGNSVPVPLLNAPNPWGNGTTSGGDFEGRVFFIPAGATAVPDVTGQTPSAVLYTKQINVSPRAFTEGFPGVASQTS